MKGTGRGRGTATTQQVSIKNAGDKLSEKEAWLLSVFFSLSVELSANVAWQIKCRDVAEGGCSKERVRLKCHKQHQTQNQSAFQFAISMA